MLRCQATNASSLVLKLIPRPLAQLGGAVDLYLLVDVVVSPRNWVYFQ